MTELTREDIARRIDHTLLKPNFSRDELKTFYQDLQKYPFASACVPPFMVAETAKLLIGTKTDVCTVVGFPLGHVTTSIKLMEAVQAMEAGAIELDAVINLTWARQGRWAELTEEIGQLALVTHMKGATLKIIIETGLFDDEDIRSLCRVCAEAEADFVKSSTGFIAEGATVEAIRLMRDALPARIRIKASGGIRDFATFAGLLDAGADRIGTSAGIKIIEHADAE